jgi:DUF2075 family protein
MKRFFFKTSIKNLIDLSEEDVLGKIMSGGSFDINLAQKTAWEVEVQILQKQIMGLDGLVYFEYTIPRMGKRVDVVLLIESVLFVLEFKVGEKHFSMNALDQVWDYALDLKNFHSASFDRVIVPILIATEAEPPTSKYDFEYDVDKIFRPIKTGPTNLGEFIKGVLKFIDQNPVDSLNWEEGFYCPTPTIVEAATALYGGHNVESISRSDATAINLSQTSNEISEIIQFSKDNSLKSICFVTGVPGAGKTLVGLNIATKHIDKSSQTYSVFLSGNGPLVAVLREALARDKVSHEKSIGRKVKKGEVLSTVKSFIQNVHHFRDECLVDSHRAPIEHVALFDEAQRAWDIHQTSKFMKTKKNRSNFNISESEFLISCLDRHKDWAVIVCLVGGGQEINQGEAGISEWVDSILLSFPHWNIYISPKLKDSEYNAKVVLKKLMNFYRVQYREALHLSVSMRSFRAENVSLFVKQVLDINPDEARTTLSSLKGKYPIVITRSLSKAKNWLKTKARGSERYGLVVSSRAVRLKPHAIDVKTPVNPVHWFLNEKDDVRASYFLEDVATEFHIQGLELDWTCVTWDADFRFERDKWNHYSFVGSRWNRINKPERKSFQINSYRVLLTRARQGMIIVIPEGEENDHTRLPQFYDPIYNYFQLIGLEEI